MLEILVIIILFMLHIISQNRIKFLENECRRLRNKTNLIDLKCIDKNDLRKEIEYIDAIKNFKYICKEFKESCKKVAR